MLVQHLTQPVSTHTLPSPARLPTLGEVHSINSSLPAATPTVPPGFILHSEGTTSILFKAPPGAKSSAATESTSSAVVFLNPVQQYNRDLSVVAIRTWSEQRQELKAGKWEEQVRRKWERQAGKGKGRKRAAEVVAGAEEGEGKKARLADGSAVEGGVEVEEGKSEAEVKVEAPAKEEAGEVKAEVEAVPAKVSDGRDCTSPGRWVPVRMLTELLVLLSLCSAAG